MADASPVEGLLLGTKFRIPSMRAGQVARPRLVAQLERGGRGKLTLLSAPPGFGKTTLLAEWLAPLASSGDVAWVSLEQADNLPATFWRYVLTALAGAREEVKATGALELVEASRPPPIETPLGLVLNAVGASARDLWLVLDDYHVIDDAEITRGMAYLVDHLPPQLHLVLASREDPALPLPRLRTRGELTDIRARDLRLTLEEADLFLNALMGLELGSEDVARLEARTEGWAGALQLAALSLRGRDSRTEFIRAFSGDDRYIVDYLVDEVLQRQPDDVREFLLRTSILDRLSSSLCDTVTGGNSARAMLDNLERNNLFVVPLDDQRRWFRYHQLFSDVLKAQLADLHPGEVAPLHQRASDWYAANGEPDRAIQHALAAKDFVRAASVIELQAETVVRHHHPDRLIAWLKAIPPRVISTMPVLSTYYGHALQGMGDMEGSAARLDDAERLLTETGAAEAVVVDQRSFAMLPALISVGRGYLAMAARDTRATVTFAEDVLSRVSGDDYHWLGTSTALLGLAHWFEGELEPAQEYHARAVGYFELEGDTGLAITSAYHDAELLKARGRLRAAQRRLESMLARVMEEGGAAARGAANLHLGLSDIHCERNDLDAAAVELANADRLGVFPPRTPFRRCLVEARLSQVRGDFEGAIRLLDEAERLQIRGAVPDTRPVAAWRAGLWAAQGRFGDAMDWARTQGIAVTDEPRYATEYSHITLARIFLERMEPGDADAAAGLLERLLAAAEHGGRFGTVLEIRALLSRGYLAQGAPARALDILTPALLAAAPEGYERLFIDAGPSLMPLFREALELGTAPDLCRRLIAGTAAAATAPAARASKLDALSEREMEVLRLLASEASGPEIAAALVVSLNTLRTHTKNIFAKLGVTNRRAAVRQAQELGLL